MANKRTYFDLAIGESDGNGGDLQQLGNDLAVIRGQENQVYLALFGGNVEASTPAISNSGQNFDYWGNRLFYGDRPDQQFNSETERTLNTTALNSSGRIRIENAVKTDLDYLRLQGARVTVNVTIPAVNAVKIEVRVEYTEDHGSLTVITFGKRFPDGDFSIFDFNEDFY